MVLEKTEARIVCADEGQQQFNRPTDQSLKSLNSGRLSIPLAETEMTRRRECALVTVL
jgi:hypothetical protein